MKHRTLIVAGVVVLVLAVWFVGLWRPTATRLTSAKRAVTAAQQQQTTLRSQLLSLRALESKLPSQEASLTQSAAALPGSPSVDTMIDQIAAVASKAGVSWTNESQSMASAAGATTGAAASAGPASSSSGSAATLTLTLQVAGPYSAVETFVNDLAQVPRLIVVDSLRVNGNSNSVTAQIDGRAFYDTTPIPKLPATVTPG